MSGRQPGTQRLWTGGQTVALGPILGIPSHVGLGEPSPSEPGPGKTAAVYGLPLALLPGELWCEVAGA